MGQENDIQIANSKFQNKIRIIPLTLFFMLSKEISGKHTVATVSIQAHISK
jgi:hypothetical protein